jgi:hypothetical protein
LSQDTEPDQSSPYHHILSLQDPSYYYPSTYVLVFPVASFPLNFLRVPLLPIHATGPTHHILHGFIIPIILGEEYKPRNSSLCSFLHSPVTSSFFGKNILLSTLFSKKHKQPRTNDKGWFSSLGVGRGANNPSP